ncbi:predicted protein [Sclerotinia sclerotiorum 1980 UF-70]|uniref:Uncharacterized protein n=1 Tax=Sclerotinia sclerotiorum (strain ATCC 18683 / 1980 / Ss-1) TaxID=665079 RepID=A7EDE6_SCLS1|nr:predicted protein [Sclerotinia sclerotiorum 1980 UF-70]EDO00862.1 predicted protein [Sclerotinia sclerotiorum 1980 UF-70]
MASPIEKATLRCWTCGLKYTRTQETCNHCHGWTVNTHECHNGETRILSWNIFQVTKTDSREDKAPKL